MQKNKNIWSKNDAKFSTNWWIQTYWSQKLSEPQVKYMQKTTISKHNIVKKLKTKNKE